MNDEPETLTCEHCQKPFPVDAGQNICVDTGPWCDDCATEWRSHFDQCKHVWEPQAGEDGPGQYCAKCCGFVLDEDMPLFAGAA